MIKRGEIYMAQLPITEGSHVQGGLRPVIIIRNDVGNMHSPTVQIVPLTSKVKNPLPVHMVIEGCGLRCASTLLPEQMQTVDRSKLKKCIGMLTDALMRSVNNCVLMQLGIL